MNETGDDQASITEEVLEKNDDNKMQRDEDNLESTNTMKVHNGDHQLTEELPEILLQGRLLKQSRNHWWQDRYFVFRSDQTLTYQRKHDDDTPRAVYRISRKLGCEISDIYVEQTRTAPNQYNKQVSKESSAGGGSQLLYCISISFPDETAESVAATTHHVRSDSLREDSSLIGPRDTLSPEWSGGRPSSPKSLQRSNSKNSSRLLSHRHSDLGQRSNSINDDLSVESAGLSLPGTENRKKKKLSFLRRRRGKKNQQSVDLPPRSSGYFDDESLGDVFGGERSIAAHPVTPAAIRHQRSQSRESPVSGVLSMEFSSPIMKFDDHSASNSPFRKERLARSDVTGNPLNDSFKGAGDSISLMELPAVPLAGLSEDGQYHFEGDVGIMRDRSFYLSHSERIANLSQTLDEYGVEKKPSTEEQNLVEREMLHNQFLYRQRMRRAAVKKRAVVVTKVGVAAGTAIGVGLVTAGVGIVAGLAFLGISAVVGGTAGAAEVGLKNAFKKKDHLTIATTNYELAKLWKHRLDACLEQESFKQSTWGQLFIAEGRKTTNALISTVWSMDEDDPSSRAAQTIPRAIPKERTNRKATLFLKDPNFFAHAQAQWKPLEGGWVSFLGSGAQSLRVFKEESFRIDRQSQRIAPLAVGGSVCTPLRTQVVLNAHPTEAFLCIMSYARIRSLHSEDYLSPNSGQTASYRLIEKYDDHTDVIHLFCRKLFLFPSWTEARDFVLLRYWRYEPDGSYVICYESIEHPLCPPQRSFVRGEMHQVYTIAPPKVKDYRKKSPNESECLLTSVVQVDPKGWIPARPIFFFSNQTYADAFGVSALTQTLDIRDAIENDRFLDLSPDLHHPTPSFSKEGCVAHSPQDDYDLRYVNRERCDSFKSERFGSIVNCLESLSSDKWAEPDANSFLVRGPSYKDDSVKVNAGASIGQLIAVDLVQVDKPIYSGMSIQPSERIQLGLAREKILKGKGLASDMPPFIFVVNIVLPGPPFYHGVFYFAVDDMSTINGSDGTPSSKLCQRFLFGSSDEFRDRTFKLIPRIVEGNFMVRKAVGSTPAIMGTKLKQFYVRHERFMEVILDCGSSAVATGVIRVSLGYAKSLVVDMGFLLEGDDDEYLPERIFGAVRIKYPSFGPHLRKVEEKVDAN